MNRNVLTSIIIPVYNVENYLDQCMESVVKQSHTNLEILLVDDCSPDDSWALCVKWKDQDPRVKIFQNTRNIGSASTRNKGVEEAHGKYLFFLDSDDWLAEDAIEKLLELAEESGADVCGGTMENVNSVTKATYIDYYHSTEKIAKDSYMNWSMCNKLFKTAFYKRNGIAFPPGLPYEDAVTYPVVHRLANRIEIIQSVTYFYRSQRAGSNTSNYKDMLLSADAIEFMISNFEKRKLPVNDIRLCEAALMLAVSKVKESSVKYEQKLFSWDEYMGLFKQINDVIIKKGILQYAAKKDMDQWFQEILKPNRNELLLSDEKIQIIKKYENLILYGAGRYARKAILELEQNNITKFRCAVTIEKNETYIMGNRICEIGSININKEDTVILIAVGEKLQKEMINNARNLGYENIVAVGMWRE